MGVVGLRFRKRDDTSRRCKCGDDLTVLNIVEVCSFEDNIDQTAVWCALSIKISATSIVLECLVVVLQLSSEIPQVTRLTSISIGRNNRKEGARYNPYILNSVARLEQRCPGVVEGQRELSQIVVAGDVEWHLKVSIRIGITCLSTTIERPCVIDWCFSNRLQ